jgi:hypothetical protein
MKKKVSLITFIMVVASLAAAAAIIVSHIDKIYEFLETCKKAAEESCSRCRSCCSDLISPKEEESDFEDVEL